MKIGWIGTGVMGKAMCRRLMDAGHELNIWTRSPEKAQELLASGAAWCESASGVTETSEIVCSMVGYPDDVRQIYFGDDGILASLSAGQIAIDFTTSRPALAQEIYVEARKVNASSLDAPVSGGDIGATNGTLSIMVGGDDVIFEQMKPVLATLGKTIVLQGGPGSGQQTKLTNQILIAGNMIGVCEALLFARQAGLDLETVLQSVSTGAAGSWSLTNLAPRIMKGDFEPGFYVEHFVKDLGIALEECRRMNIKLNGLELAYEIFTALQQAGGAKRGTQAVIQTIAERAGVAW